MKRDQGLACINGEVVSLVKAKVSVLDRGFLYGDQIIETMLALDGKIIRLESHMMRLTKSLEIIGIQLNFSLRRLAEECQNIVTQIGAYRVMIRVIVTAGSGTGLQRETADLDPWEICHRYILAWPINEPSSYLYDQGLALRLVTRESADLCFLKTGFYLPAIYHLQQRSSVGKKRVDILWVSEDQEILEASSANIFFVERSDQISLITPQNDHRIFSGLSRARVLQLAQEHQIAVVQRPVFVEEVSSFSECFLSSSVQGLVPVSSLGEHRFNEPEKKEMFQFFKKHF